MHFILGGASSDAEAVADWRLQAPLPALGFVVRFIGKPVPRRALTALGVTRTTLATLVLLDARAAAPAAAREG